MTYLEGYQDTLEQVRELEETEGLRFMWTVNDLLENALHDAPEDEAQAYTPFFPIMVEADNHIEFANKTEDLRTNYALDGSHEPEYVEDIVTNLYQEALNRL